MSYKTAWLLLHKIRQAMGEREQSWVVDGIVEMDDALFGGVTVCRKGSDPKRQTHASLAYKRLNVGSRHREFTAALKKGYR